MVNLIYTRKVDFCIIVSVLNGRTAGRHVCLFTNSHTLLHKTSYFTYYLRAVEEMVTAYSDALVWSPVLSPSHQHPQAQPLRVTSGDVAIMRASLRA